MTGVSRRDGDGRVNGAEAPMLFQPAHTHAIKKLKITEIDDLEGLSAFLPSILPASFYLYFFVLFQNFKENKEEIKALLWA